MRLAEKLLSRAGKAPSAGADRDPPAAARAITAPAKADEADAGGVLTFGDVASARGSDAAADTAARWSAGAVKRVGSIKFAAPKRGASRGVPDATGDGGEKRARGAPRGAEHVDFPADWTLKTHVKFTSTAPLRWAAAASGGPEASDGGVRAFAGARARADPDRPPAHLARGGGNGGGGNGGALRDDDAARDEDVLSSRERVCRALCAWTYPADPMAPELVAALRALPGAAGKQWLERRLDDGWREALLGAYAALRVGDCPFFYVVFPERVALFRAPAETETREKRKRDTETTSHDDIVSHAAAGTGGFAVVTEASSGKFRDALVAARVPHACVGADPRAGSSRTGRAGFTGLQRRAGADGDGRGHGGAYGHGIPLEEWAQEDFAEAYKDEADFQALDAHGKPLVRSPERLARRNGARLAERDARAAERAVLVRGAAAVHALVCLLTEAEATGGDPAGAASAARDAPLIMAPAPFAGASLRRVDLRVSRAETTYEIAPGPGDFEDEENDDEKSREKRKTVKKRRVYVAECSGGGAGGAIPIPPWCVSRLAEALCDEQAENVVGSFRALGASAALNAAVAAAAGPVPGDEADDVAIPREKNVSKTFQEGGGAFTPRERERIRSSSRLGARGVERVERADGVWYVNPESASRNAR